MKTLILDRDSVLDAVNICSGLFSPLKGFLTYADYRNVVNNMHLASGEPWVMPVTLAVEKDERRRYMGEKSIRLTSPANEDIAVLHIEDVFEVDACGDVKLIYGTGDETHPGVSRELSRSRMRIGGRIEPLSAPADEFGEYVRTPDETKRIFREKGWKTVAGFQTRNPIHRAHEYLQRSAFDMTDGLFIHPLIGWKKKGDFSPEAIIASYGVMLDNFYPKEKVFFSVLRTQMRYAGPREAVFHAQIRRNHGCTHFIVGRDHAGVGGYYGKYAAHDIFSEFDDLGIEIIKQYGPFYCGKCGGMTTEDVCPHGNDARREVSGTSIRDMIRKGLRPPEEVLRSEVADVLVKLNSRNRAFCGE